MTLPNHVEIVEVGPRDGLQNEPQTLSIEQKLTFISELADTGISHIEAGSFVNPRWVPQMADSDQLFERLPESPSVRYSALVPNLQGLERALASGAHCAAVFIAASETFSRKNTNCSIDDSLRRCAEILDRSRQAKVPVRGYISCVVGCPYEGEVPIARVVALVGRLFRAGCYEVCLADTTGVGTAGRFTALLAAVTTEVPAAQLAVHCHDTYGQALTNIYAALQAGVAVVDSAVAGLGGCPYALGASGNVASEDLVYMLQGLGIDTGIDLDRLVSCGNNISTLLDRRNGSRVASAMSNQKKPL